MVTSTPYPQDVIESAARICYNSPAQTNPDRQYRFIKNLIKRGHESVIEHASATFEITCSRVCAQQITRHRIASYSMRSQRYVTESGPTFVIPPGLDDHSIAIMEISFLDSTWRYKTLITNGIKPENARFVLPNATATILCVTMNFRSLRNFIKLRMHKSAQWEIRSVAQQMLNVLEKLAPAVFSDLQEE